jgi:succinoglycan biosynthesis transport protein ExoP
VQDLYPYPMQQPPPTLPEPFAPQWPSAPVQEDTFDLRGSWAVIHRHTWLILSLFIAAELLTLLVLLIKTPLYTALSTILIESPTPEVLQPNIDRDTQENTNSFYKTQYEILKSRTLAASVIRTLELDKNPHFNRPETKPTLSRRLLSSVASWLSVGRPARVAINRPDILGVKPELIDKYLSELTIKPEYDTRLVVVAFTNPDPLLVATTANAHVQAYIQQGYELRSRSSEAARRFLKAQAAELEKGLEQSEAALNDYRRKLGIIAFSLNDKDRLGSERMANLNKAYVEAEELRIGLQAEVETVNSHEYDAVPEVVNNSLIQNLKVELSRLQGQYANLSNQFTPDYPDVAQLHAQLAQVQRREQQEISRVVQSIQSKYRAALDRETELGKRLQDEKTRALSLNDASLQDAILTREVATNRALYTSVLGRMKVLGVNSEAQVTNVSVIDAAGVPKFPSSPKKKLSLVLAGFVALMLGVGAAFYIESSDEGLKTADGVQQYLRLPNLATVPYFSSKKEWMVGAKPLLRLSKWKDETDGKYESALKRNVPSTDECPAANVGATLVPSTPSSYAAASEAYRTIRTSILLSCAETPPQIVLFTSTVAGEGKTVTAINTAIAFASMFDRVLLIDGDLRRSRCHQIVNGEPGPGLAEVLSGLSELDEAIQPTATKGLFLLSGGLHAPNPSELLGSRKMRQILDTVRSSYDYVLIDSAPVLPVSDSVILSTLVDGVVVVVGSNTAKLLARDTCSRLSHVGARMFGAVLNNVTPQQHSYYASHYLYRKAG